jgi:hypothetical protein
MKRAISESGSQAENGDGDDGGSGRRSKRLKKGIVIRLIDRLLFSDSSFLPQMCPMWLDHTCLSYALRHLKFERKAYKESAM